MEQSKIMQNSLVPRFNLLVAVACGVLGIGSAWGQTVAITSVSQPSIVLIKDGAVLKSEATLTVTSSGPTAAWVKISVPGEAPYFESVGNLKVGINTVDVNVIELDKPAEDVTFEVFDNAAGTGSPLTSKTISQKKIRRWTMYVANDCHVDIGYTTTQENLKRNLYPSYLDSAMDYATVSAAWPVESRFTYPVESSFMIYDGTWISRKADWQEDFKGFLKSGRISYPASYFNYSTETMGTEEMARSNYISSRHLRDMLGVPPGSAGYMTDNPGLSWSFVDALAESGVKGYQFRFNDTYDKWDILHNPRLFFLRGRNPANKVLIWNGGHYMMENAQISPDFGFKGTNSVACHTQVMAWFTKLEQDGYAQDAWLSMFTGANAAGWVDNSGINTNVMQRIKGFNDLQASKGYAYPKIIASNHGDFFDHILAGDVSSIPVMKGDVESWWNLGVPSTAYETGRNRDSQDKLGAAETFATIAAAGPASKAYPQTRLTMGWKNMFTWDEHTWGSAGSRFDDQWNWKRNTALISDGVGDEVLGSSLAALGSTLHSDGFSIAVFNSQAWERNDLVKVPLGDLPKFFDIVNPATGKPVRYQKLEDGNVLFLAEKVPGLGYKVYQVVSRKDEPQFTGSMSATANTLENGYFKLTFDATGSLSSIWDKHANRELVDAGAPVKFNQLQAHTDTVLSSFTLLSSAALHSKVGPLMAEMVADGAKGVKGIESLQRRVILYDSLPRIDIENAVMRDTGGFKTDYHFVFPFNIDNYTIRHEMPTGALLPGVSPDVKDTSTEQLYSSSTDHYAVNRWVDISDNNAYGIAFSSLTAPMVSYGERRTMKFDATYNHKNPWIWSMIYNNHWFTNFQATQPGLTNFRYSFQPHDGKDWSEGGTPRIGAAVHNPLQAIAIKGSQAGAVAGASGSYMGISAQNVVLTTAKVAEANGEGLIFRFNENSGRNTTVTVDFSWFQPTSAQETDLVENDRSTLTLTQGKITFDIFASGWKTIRIKRGSAPAQVAGVQGVILADGCRVTWTEPVEPGIAYYEVFRSIQSDFTAGTGSYMGTAQNTWFFDPQVVTGQTHAYYYRIRAVRAGAKGLASEATKAVAGSYTDNKAPTVPELVRVDRLHGTRVSMEWTPSEDDKYVAAYEVYRGGVKIETLDPILNSYADSSIIPWNNLPYYQIVAVDKAGNRSALGKSKTSGPVLPDWINVAPNATVSVSSEFDVNSHPKANVVDGKFGKQDVAEWASAGEVNPWVKLDWSTAQDVRAIVVYDRSNPIDNVMGGTLSFSDGTSIKVVGIPTWGEAKLITFPMKQVSWIKFQAEGSQGVNGGLSELSVLGDDRIAISILAPQRDARAWKTANGDGGVGNSNGGRKLGRGIGDGP